MGNEFVARLIDVDKTYKVGGIEVAVLQGVTLSITRGEFVAVLGSAGSGRTALLNIIACVSPATSGRVVVGGTDITKAGGRAADGIHHRFVGILSRPSNLIPNLTGFENVELSLHLAGAERDEGRPDRILSEVGLEGRGTAPPDGLTKLETSRLAMAKSLANDPRLLVCDDPTSHLNPEEAGELMKLMRRLSDTRELTIVLGTGDPEVAETADRVVRVVRGKVHCGERGGD
jgi:ABC-type lipoprotein export system ATPase subunit